MTKKPPIYKNTINIWHETHYAHNFNLPTSKTIYAIIMEMRIAYEFYAHLYEERVVLILKRSKHKSENKTKKLCATTIGRVIVFNRELFEKIFI